MIRYKQLFIAFIFILLSSIVFAQTVGIGEVTSIEAKAKSYESNTKKIEQYKLELPDLEVLWKKKLQKLKDELAALYKERDDLIADMKVGAKCSQCGKYKSEFEKEGKNFEQHLGEVKGYAIPATTTELETTRKVFTEKIAIKKVQINNLEKGDNEIVKKQNDIKKLELENEKLCKEITTHSKNHETKVVSEAKSKHENWAKDLMIFATNILIADDKITIYKAQITRYEQEFLKESEEIKEQVKKENLEEQNQKKTKIEMNEQKIEQIKIAQTNDLAPLENNLAQLIEQKDETERELKNSNLNDIEKVDLTNTLNQLLSKITSITENIDNYKTNVKNKIKALEEENTNLRSDIFQLVSNLTKQQMQEIEKIKPIYDQKKSEAKQAVTTATAELADSKKIYAEKTDFYKKQNQLYLDQVIAETDRITIAGKSINCPVWNDARFQVSANWNKVFPCVNAITTMAKPYSTNVFNSYCPEIPATTYMSNYKSFLNSLNNDDKDAVKGNSNANWFEKITE